MKYENGEFIFIDEKFSLLKDGRWTGENTAVLLPLVNEFYKDTNFSAFFTEHIPFYEEHSVQFKHELLDRLNIQWFASHGLAPEVFEPVISPSNDDSGYGPSISDGGKIIKVSPILPTSDDYSQWMDLLVHEICHSFSNPAAEILYKENETFRKQCDETVDKKRMPFYPNGQWIAYEYVTRANTMQYMAENENADIIKTILFEMEQGFPYFAQVYALLTNSEPIKPPEDIVKYILGTDYKFCQDEHSYEIDGEEWRWRFIDLLGQKIYTKNFSLSCVGNIFDTKTGDIVYLTYDEKNYVYIDIGPANEEVDEGCRSYSVSYAGHA
jgi:hypothetical protein